MKADHLSLGSLINAIAVFCLTSSVNAEPLSLALRPNGPQVELSWPAAMTNPSPSLVFPEYEIQYSSDLRSWKAVTGKLRGVDGRSGPLLSRSLDKLPG